MTIDDFAATHYREDVIHVVLLDGRARFVEDLGRVSRVYLNGVDTLVVSVRLATETALRLVPLDALRCQAIDYEQAPS